MPLFLFFVNKPFSIWPYLIGIIILLGITALEPDIFPLPFVFFLFSFTAWYSLFLIYYYVLREGGYKIFGIEVEEFQPLFSVTLWVIGLAIVAACIGIGYWHSSFGSIIFLFVITCFSMIIFQCVFEAKLLSEGIRRNASLNDLNINDLYIEIRKLLLTKVIQR